MKKWVIAVPRRCLAPTIPKQGGLYCERIFGTTIDWECVCGKYNRMKYRGITCDKCGVEVTNSRVRRSRMGHIDLSAPVVHPWYYKGRDCMLGKLLGVNKADLENVISMHAFIVLDSGKTALVQKQILNEQEYRAARDKFGKKFKVRTGVEAIRWLLSEFEINSFASELRKKIRECNIKTKRSYMEEQLAIVDGCRNSHIAPEWMVLDVMLVLPPDLRPMIPLGTGQFATDSLNDFYRKIIDRNNCLRKLKELRAPTTVIRNGMVLLQEAVNALFLDRSQSTPVFASKRRFMFSLEDRFQEFRGNYPTLLDRFLYKRVDHSGTTRIVATNTSSIDIADLPEFLAWDLLKWGTMRELMDNGCRTNRNAQQEIKDRTELAWNALQKSSANVIVLAGIEDSPWRLFGLRVKLSNQQALGVNHNLLDHLGWHLLGKKVRLFAVLSREASKPMKRLLPSVLLKKNKSTSVDLIRKQSVWCVNSDDAIPEFTQRALFAQRFPTTTYDRLVACAQEKP